MKHFRIYIVIILTSLLVSCDTFNGCGMIVEVCAPKPVTTTRYYNGYRYTYYTGNYYYPVVVQKDNGKRYTIYTSYSTWNRAHYEEDMVICSD